MDQSIQNRCRLPFAAKHLGPDFERQIGRHDHPLCSRGRSRGTTVRSGRLTESAIWTFHEPTQRSAGGLDGAVPGSAKLTAARAGPDVTRLDGRSRDTKAAEDHYWQDVPEEFAKAIREPAVKRSTEALKWSEIPSNPRGTVKNPLVFRTAQTASIPERARTSNLWLRRPTLYPIELRRQGVAACGRDVENGTKGPDESQFITMGDSPREVRGHGR